MINDIIFELKNKLLRKEAYRQYLQCLEYQRLSGGGKLDLSFKKRQQLVTEAYSCCPFYRKYYDSKGFHPSMLASEVDWAKVPILEKKMIREYASEMISSKVTDMGELGASTTGGSTGKPLIVYKSRHNHYEVLGWRALQWWGVSPAANEGIIHRRVPVSFKQKLFNRILWWPTRRAYLSATRITSASMGSFIAEVKSKRIKWLVGYCGSLELLADYVLNNNIKVECVELVWSTSSPLTQIVRGKIEQAFNCKVMDQYGCCEMGHIAIQRPEEECLTINSDYVWVDIVNGESLAAHNELGDVCITDLNTPQFPLIKYRLGDRSRILKTMDESADGFPRMDFVRGRITDMVYLPDGSVVDGSFLTTICDSYSEYISCYQIHQYSDYSITFKVVTKGNDAAPVVRKVEKTLSELVKNSVKITTEEVDRIEDFEGKRKFIISEIALAK